MNSKITSKVRKLRGNQTPAEIVLWDYLRVERLGVKFRRQQPLRVKLEGEMKLFIADFYCPKAKLVIEVDGSIHLSQKDYDRVRDWLIRQLGIRVLRFTNDQVLNDIKSVTKAIVAAIKSN